MKWKQQKEMVMKEVWHALYYIYLYTMKLIEEEVVVMCEEENEEEVW